MYPTYCAAPCSVYSFSTCDLQRRGHTRSMVVQKLSSEVTWTLLGLMCREDWAAAWLLSTKVQLSQCLVGPAIPGLVFKLMGIT